MPSSNHNLRDPRFRAAAALTLILLASFLLRFHHLGHRGIKALDESFHALVAKNLTKHPFTPTLIDRPWLEYDWRDWQSNHVWLHKPIVPLWQMAASMKAFGTSTLAMRLPSVLLATAAVWLTYAIGRDLVGDRRVALIGAAIQAFHPGITALVQGYVFSDHIDIAFLFWVELAVWCLVRAVKAGSLGWTIAAGAAQGVAFLSKTYPAFVVTGVALLAWLLPLRGFAQQSTLRFRGRHVLILLGATLITAAPWTVYCLIRFPREFYWEQLQVLRHITHDVEQWAAPWDRLIFDFSLRIYLWFYPAVLVATVLMLRAAWREKSLALWLLLGWGLGVLIPHTLATSKTMTATLIGWPPFFLLLGVMIIRAVDGDVLCLGAWMVASVLAALTAALVRGAIPAQGWGYPDPPAFAAIMRQNIWVLWHVLAALAGAATAVFALRQEWLTRERRVVLIIIASVASLYLGGRMARLAWRVADGRPDLRDRPSFVELGPAINEALPADAVILLEIRQKMEHIAAMFFIDRTVYAVDAESIEQTARAIRAAGGTPFLATEQHLPLPLALREAFDGRWVYALPETHRLTPAATQP